MKILIGGDISFSWMPEVGASDKIITFFKEPSSLFNDDAAFRIHANHISAGIKNLRGQVDYFCLNLECALSERGEIIEGKKYHLQADPKYSEVLKKIGVDGVTLANNHILDYGPDALEDTIAQLVRYKIDYTGLKNKSELFQKPLLIEKQNEKVALLNFVQADIIDPSPDLFLKHDPSVATIEKDFIIQSLENIDTATPVIVVFHWGQEWSFIESDEQRKLAQLCIDHGAAAVIGHHSHLCGRVEEYKGKPIVYSLGNFMMQLPPFSMMRAKTRPLVELEFGNSQLFGYKLHSLNSDSRGYPVVEDSFETASLYSNYLPEEIKSDDKIIFDSVAQLKNADVKFENDGMTLKGQWSDEFDYDQKIILGRLPVSPGFKFDQSWNGVGLSHELAKRSYMTSNLTYTDNKSTLSVTYDIPKDIKRLLLIHSVPEWFQHLKEFQAPVLEIYFDNDIYLLKRNQAQSGIRIIEEIDLTKHHSQLKNVTIKFFGVAQKQGYLLWRLLGF